MEILTKEDKATVSKALKDCDILRAEIAKAKRAGIDVAELEARLREAELALKNIAKVYIEK